MNKYMILFFLLFLQACASDKPKHFDTTGVSPLDGAWLGVSCLCNGKDTFKPDQQSAYVFFINGNVMFQNLTGRFKKSKLKRYCSSTEVATIIDKGSNTYEVTTHSEQTYSPKGQGCTETPGPVQRTWKILSLTANELKYESTKGCESGPLVCISKRLDQ